MISPELKTDLDEVIKMNLQFSLVWINPSGFKWQRCIEIMGGSYATSGVISSDLKHLAALGFGFEDGRIFKEYS